MYEQNLQRIQELKENKQYAAKIFLDDLLSEGKNCVIQDVRRTQDEQYFHYCKGRNIEDLKRALGRREINENDFNACVEILRKYTSLSNLPQVTWTVRSLHIQGLAMDIKPINCSFDDLKRIAAKYGITQPLKKDRWHHEFTNAIEEPKSPVGFSFPKTVKSLMRAITRSKPPTKNVLERRLQRIDD